MDGMGQRTGCSVMMKTSKAEPRWDRDLKYGGQGELLVDDFLTQIANGNGRVETKRKSYLDHRIYVETHCDKGRTGHYEPSGIMTSQADLWCFVIADTGIHIAVPADLLREMLDDSSTRDRQERDGNCPTKGKLIDFCVLLYRLKKKKERDSA
jgi:hypothetical protein